MSMLHINIAATMPRIQLLAQQLTRPILLAVVCTLSACSTVGPVSQQSSSLERWIDTEGVRYITEQLSADPRFKGAKVQLVHMDGELISPEVDQLSDSLRRQVFDAALGVKGIELAVRPEVRPWQAQRTLASVDCGVLKPATHVIGLDLRESLSGDTRLSIKARDLRDNSWVSGFGTAWSGRLNARQQDARRTRATDLSLRGLRELPFAAGQADLTASYLAHNLSCLLQQGASERLRVYIEPVPYGTPDYFNTVSTLMGRYVNQYREVDVVNDPARANALVNSDAVQLNDALWQVWVGVAFSDSGQQVSGIDTPAYVNIDPTALFGTGKIVLDTRSDLPQPAIDINAEPLVVEAASTDTATAADAGVASTTDSTSMSTTSPSANARPPSDQSDTPTASANILHLGAVVPASNAQCKQDNPWDAGERRVPSNGTLQAGDCFAITAGVKGNAAFLIAHTGEDEWYRLIGSSCQSPQFADPRSLARQGLVRFPHDATMAITGAAGQETFHLVVARDEKGTRQVEGLLSQLPDLCESLPGSKASPMAKLRRLMDASGGTVISRTLTVRKNTGV